MATQLSITGIIKSSQDEETTIKDEVQEEVTVGVWIMTAGRWKAAVLRQTVSS